MSETHSNQNHIRRQFIDDFVVRQPARAQSSSASPRPTPIQHPNTSHINKPVNRGNYVDGFVATRPQISRPASTSNIAAHELESRLKPNPTTQPPQTAKAKKIKKRDPKVMPIMGHLQELRKRLMYSILALTAGGVLGYIHHDRIIELLVRPLQKQLFYSSPTGGFDFLIKTCLFFGFVLAVPVLVYNLVKFIAPAVPNHVTYKTFNILSISTLLAIAGIAFAYFISLPAALHFLNNFSGEYITSLISANEYFTFVMIYLAGFAALFQMPLIIAFINKITPLTPRLLMQKQRIIIVMSFIVAAILTPTPDPINQTLMAMPIIALYQSSVGVVWQANRKTKKREKRERARVSQLATA